MNKLTYILWAAFSTFANNHVLSVPQTPLSFKRGTDEHRLVHCDYERPGWATFESPTGQRLTEQLADGDVGQLVVAYGNATGTKIELPPIMGQEQADAAGAGSGSHP
jgi:hypothetical protein